MGHYANVKKKKKQRHLNFREFLTTHCDALKTIIGPLCVSGCVRTSVCTDAKAAGQQSLSVLSLR